MIGGSGDGGSASGNWLFTGQDGRLTAYLPAEHGLLRLTEPASGHLPWTGPDLVEVPGWTGRVAMAQSPEGYVYLAVLRRPRTADGALEVAFATQFQTGRGLTDWRSLGAPASPGVPGDSVVAGPLIEVNKAIGTVHVVVSLRAGGIVRRSRNADGVWGGWKSVTAEAYPHAFATVMTTGGPLEILATGPAGTDRWVGVAQGRFELRERLGTPLVDGTQIAYETGPKRATYYWRYPGDGSLVAWRAQGQQAQGGGLIPLGGAGAGAGPTSPARSSEASTAPCWRRRGRTAVSK